jgi:excisionase family DNA binding protein
MTGTVALVLTPEQLEEAIARAVEPLRVEIERLRSERSRDPVPIPEAARRLGVSVRSVNRWIRSGDLKVVQIGGLRRVLLPDGNGQR